jgi:hypothetical protein
VHLVFAALFEDRDGAATVAAGGDGMTDPKIYFFIVMVVVTAILAASVIIDAMGEGRDD